MLCVPNVYNVLPRILKPGGLFVFVEPDGGQDNVIELMQKVGPTIYSIVIYKCIN